MEDRQPLLALVQQRLFVVAVEAFCPSLASPRIPVHVQYLIEPQSISLQTTLVERSYRLVPDGGIGIKRPSPRERKTKTGYSVEAVAEAGVSTLDQAPRCSQTKQRLWGPHRDS